MGEAKWYIHEVYVHALTVYAVGEVEVDGDLKWGEYIE